MKNAKQLERNWTLAFQQSNLVDGVTGKFNPVFAQQLFYGKHNNDYPAQFPHHFNELYTTYLELDESEALRQLIVFWEFIGIQISFEEVSGYLQAYPNQLSQIFKKTYYILKTLAHRTAELDITNPYVENRNDIFYLLNIVLHKANNNDQQQLQLFEDVDLPTLYNRYVNIPEGYEKDPIIQHLFNTIEKSNTSFFITGKAGTGKSTFLHYFAQQSKKNVLMTAFTGIAAINVGGVTLHSFFKFPLKPLLPGDEEIPIFRQQAQARKIIEKTHTIVIDEVSMLRADILQAIDYSLRMNGGNHKLPFGGKQILLVGDIFQLPPVVNHQDEVEKLIFTEVYKSEYFFDAPAYADLNPTFFEFKKIHRQKNDQAFINLLNEVRACETTGDTINAINKQYDPTYSPQQDEFAITLTSNNPIANTENARKLAALPYSTYRFEATIHGDFREDRYPTHKTLELKKNAQVIFIKNDVSPDTPRRWVNGTIAKIDFISDDLLEIRLQDGSTHKLVPETWENRQYKYDREKRRIVSTVIGTFTQYPVKLAWAITIHKSQGLTFDNVIIDLGRGAFVNGQVYVALSRCRKLEGIHLRQPLRTEDIIADERIIRFYRTQENAVHLFISYEDFFLKHPEFALQYIALHAPLTEEQIELHFNKLTSGKAYYSHFLDDSQEIVPSDLGLAYNPNIRWTPALQSKFSIGLPHPVTQVLKGVAEQLPLQLAHELQMLNNSLWAFAMSQGYVKEEAKDQVNFGLHEHLLQPPLFGKLSLEEIATLYVTQKNMLLTNPSIWGNTMEQVLTPALVETLLNGIA
ncbi:UvrD-like helicase family protein [Chitinophaga skermanii]|uniref:UvrD-like helicase family protein n=1 Tax=Chitinophaga skermanii TaxID=331697 RepID=A0A327QE43_9BACT|nr:PIF1 family ATP-dependent DNA helicase [Chitinophaga skermanii]RAJ02275.1 UvrD-like helicase family protein [Chitinophaga skermanii]